jgi:hypothetical protein
MVLVQAGWPTRFWCLPARANSAVLFSAACAGVHLQFTLSLPALWDVWHNRAVELAVDAGLFRRGPCAGAELLPQLTLVESWRSAKRRHTDAITLTTHCSMARCALLPLLTPTSTGSALLPLLTPTPARRTCTLQSHVLDLSVHPSSRDRVPGLGVLTITKMRILLMAAK